MARFNDQAHSALPENALDHMIIDEFDELLEIEDDPAALRLDALRFARWPREFKTD
jgi:hypothetical protein